MGDYGENPDPREENWERFLVEKMSRERKKKPRTFVSSDKINFARSKRPINVREMFEDARRRDYDFDYLRKKYCS